MPLFNAFARRRFLRQGSALLMATALLPVRTWARPQFMQDPFQLGVASGDPSPDGFVLWTRLAPEFLTTSLTSGGDGSPTRPGHARMLAHNPHLLLANDQRGYQMFAFTPRAVHTELKVLERVEVPDARLSTLARFVVEAGDPWPHRD